ncbi:MAG: hypothetical protein IPH20_14395 [Bacteroidales bacterium]|nr:hypothetical protein [Bacteroidales bacterium]
MEEGLSYFEDETEKYIQHDENVTGNFIRKILDEFERIKNTMNSSILDSFLDQISDKYIGIAIQNVEKNAYWPRL